MFAFGKSNACMALLQKRRNKEEDQNTQTAKTKDQIIDTSKDYFVQECANFRLLRL